MQPSDAPGEVRFQDPGLFAEPVRLVAPGPAAALGLRNRHLPGPGTPAGADRTRLRDQLRRVEFKAGALKAGRRPYVLVLLEFQSDQDRDMALLRDAFQRVDGAASAALRRGLHPRVGAALTRRAWPPGCGRWRRSNGCLRRDEEGL